MVFRNKLLIGLMLALLPVLPALAGPVDVQQAGDVARAFFRNDPNTGRRMAPLTRVALYDAPLTKAGEQTPAFHIFNREGGGFVIIAGDDACKPVLAYSFDGVFGTADQLPDGLKDWLGDFEKQVDLVRTQGASQKGLEKAKEAWMEIQYPTKAGSGYQAEVLHKTAEWNQSDPYNRLCHKIDGWTCYAGCIPVAMGIIMDFFCYPAQGTGTLESYSYDAWGYADSISGYDLGHPYEWSKFHGVNFKEGFTDEQADAVAVLLRDIGVAGHAYYRPDGTDDDFWRLIPAVIEHFGYDPNVSHLKRKFFTDEEWMNMLKGDLQDHPVLYAASKEGGGHGFVVDGYDKKSNLHINWGWNGSYNGYFALSAFAPLEGYLYEFEHTTVLGLVPDKGQGGQPEEFLYYYPAESEGVFYPGLMVSETPVRSKAFQMNAVWLCNGGITPIKGKYFFALVDANGDIVEKISEEKSFDPVNAQKFLLIWKVDCKMKSYPMAGDKLKLFYRSDNWPDGVWKTPLVNNEEKRTVFEIDVAPDESKLADVTSYSYDKSTGKVTMKTMDRVTWSVKKGSTVVAEGTSKDFALSIAASELSKDSYTLTLQRGGEKQVLTIKMGK